MNIYETLHIDSPVAKIIISLALMLFFGFLATRVTKLLKLPNVTAYIVVGILLGPNVLKLIPQDIIDGMEFLPDIALAFIAFSTGEFFKFSTLKKNGGKVVVITVFESLLASILVFVVLYFIMGLNLAFAIVLAALAAATAPASTMMTIRQTGSKGDFVETLLQVVALDDIVGLVAFSIAISVATVSQSGSSVDVISIIVPLITNILILLLGAFFGLLLKFLMPKKRSTDNRLIISISMILLFCGICSLFEVSPLLGCMSMGTIYMNITNDEKLFNQLNYFTPPILLLFFVRSGLNFRIGTLFSDSSLIGGAPLLLIGVIYFIVRIIGKYIGSFAGCAIVKKKKEVRNYLGLALIPQAGVAIGLAAIGARTLSNYLGAEVGNALNTIILASSVLYELIGPACAKLSLYLSKSYSNNLDDITTVETVDENGQPKTEVEMLIERIKNIQENLPQNTESVEEQAFDEAAEEYMTYRKGFIRNQMRRR
ncbi:MAG: cation:proton antiporter [Bacilli bacterium]|nr:cation:proton antiporter [Bacilli bacterium]